MASTGGGLGTSDGFYSKLIDHESEQVDYDQLNRCPDVRLGVSQRPASTAGQTPWSGGSRLGGPWSGGPRLYRMATICLATLCAVLLISIIAVTANHKNKAQSDGAELQKQTQTADVSALTDSIKKLQEEKLQLQKEKDELQKEKQQLQKDKDELQVRLQTKTATKAPEGIKPTTNPIVCPMDWHLFNNSCYFISRTTRDWPESKSFCQSQGAHLAIIHTAEEQTFLWDLLPRGHWNSFWFGITDEHTEDEWKWVDGTPLVGGFWEEGEPNNHIDEDCGYIVKTLVLERVAVRSWYDAPCSFYLPFICEKEMSASASASTAIPH